MFCEFLLQINAFAGWPWYFFAKHEIIHLEDILPFLLSLHHSREREIRARENINKTAEMNWKETERFKLHFRFFSFCYVSYIINISVRSVFAKEKPLFWLWIIGILSSVSNFCTTLENSETKEGRVGRKFWPWILTALQLHISVGMAH